MVDQRDGHQMLHAQLLACVTIGGQSSMYNKYKHVHDAS